MTGPEEGQSATRPISVAELLAKNGSIGSPPVGGGRRRRRRGNNDAVTVAELTGEIPLVRLDEDYDPDAGDYDDVEVSYQADEVPNGNGGAAFHVDEPALERAEDPLPRRGRDVAPQRSEYPRPLRREDRELQARSAYAEAETTAGAESMSPDPIDDGMVIVYAGEPADTLTVVEAPVPQADIGDAAAPDALGIGNVGQPAGVAPELDLDDGEPVSGDLSGLLDADADVDEVLDDTDLTESFDDEYAEDYGDEYAEDYSDYYDDEPSRGRAVLHGLGIVAQSVVAVAFGAGLFLAFNQLWRWNSLVAMVLAILATLGLVAGVWVVRKTEDIASTLIAVGVGLLVTFGPLALMHAT